MKTKHFSVLLASSLLALGTYPAMAESSESTPKFSFSCQVSQGIPTTMAQQTNGKASVPVFHWKNEVLPSSANAEQLCNSVSAKLEDYSAQGYDFSSLTFGASEEAGLPAICANTSGSRSCSKVLFTLAPAEKPEIVADELLTAILDKNLQQKPLKFNDRGVQSTSYQVDFWSLLGLDLKLFK
jgi:hypothetical protein